MIETILSRIFSSQWLVLLLCVVLLTVATELSFRFGLRLHRAKDEARKAQLGGIQGAVLGLLALLLGFTFALSVARYETRRTLVVDEANAIGTTYLRAALLPEAHRMAIEDLLRRYVDVRLAYYDAGQDRGKLDEAEQSAKAIQRELWDQAVAANKDTPPPILTAFITSLNQLIDLDATRLNALRTHVPGAVWLILLVVAVCGCYVTGYDSGANGARSAFSSLLLPLLLAVVIALIADLDHPRGGLISFKQQPLIDLKQSFEVGKP